MEKINVIFLDIDGVLNVCCREGRDEFGSGFHQRFVDNLSDLIKKTDAKIVISSTWRGSGLSEMQRMWKFRKLPGEVIGITPYAIGGQFRMRDMELNEQQKSMSSLPRGLEIEWWLDQKGFQRINWSKEKQIEYSEKSEINNYVILDDDSDMLYSQREHFVKCSCRGSEKDSEQTYGFTKKALEEAVNILNTPLVELYYPLNL